MTPKELSSSLTQLNDTLQLLVQLNSEVVPQLRKQIQDISDAATGGFNTRLLVHQANQAIQAVIQEVDLTQLNHQVRETAQILDASVSSAVKQHSILQKSFNWLISTGFAILAACLGVIITWYYNHSLIDGYQSKITAYQNKILAYQYAIDKGDQMANFISSKCTYMLNFADYIGVNKNEVHTKQWIKAWCGKGSQLVTPNQYYFQKNKASDLKSPIPAAEQRGITAIFDSPAGK